MVEYIVLGIVQGIAEWLPISSEGVIVLLKTNVFHSVSVTENIQDALFLHLGTFFAALVYFRRDVIRLTQTALSMFQKRPMKNNSESTILLKFLIITTLISGSLGFVLLQTLESFENQIAFSGKLVTVSIGVLLLITGYLQLSTQKRGVRKETEIKTADSIILGVAQGFAALPGLSRSGLTISALLLRRVNETAALRVSFLMSLPIVLAGNIVMNISSFTVSFSMLIGLLASFIVGLATIHVMMRVSKKVNFGVFIILFGLITIGASLL